MIQNIPFFIHPNLNDEDNNIKHTIIREEGIILESPLDSADTNFQSMIYILDDESFENESLCLELSSQGYRVISSHYLLNCLENKLPLPSTFNYPIYNRSFEGIQVSIDNSIVEKEASQIKHKIKAMCGNVLEYDVNQSTQYLIASEVGSINYRLAVYEFGIEVIVPSWISDCWKHCTLFTAQQYLLPPLSGCVICVTGISHKTREVIEKLTIANHGTYTADMDRNCTHLLSKEPSGLKFIYAIRWGVHCVSIDWLLDSIQEGICKNENDYLIPLSDDTMFELNHASMADLSRLSPPLRKDFVAQRGSVLSFPSFSPSNKSIPISSPIPKSRLNRMGKTKNAQRSVFHKSKENQIHAKQIANTKIPTDNESFASLIKMLINQCDKTIQHYEHSMSERDYSDEIEKTFNNNNNKKGVDVLS